MEGTDWTQGLWFKVLLPVYGSLRPQIVNQEGVPVHIRLFTCVRHDGRATGRPPTLWTVAGLLGVLLCGSLGAGAQGGPRWYAPGRVLVKFRDNAKEQDKQNALAGIKAKGARKLGNLEVHAVDLPQGQDEGQTVLKLRGHKDVEFAELDGLVPAAGTTNDPGLANQWYLNNISAPAAWDITTGSSNVVVAVLDSGCDPAHPDLTPNYLPGWNFVDNNTNTSDVQGHGTAVAGCVGASGNNGIGIASVSWSSWVMPVRIAYNNNGQAYAYWSTVAQGMQWAVDHGAKIENCSYVGLTGSATIQSAAQYVYNHGGLFVACAGNDNVNPGFAANPYIIIVSGTDSGNNRAYFSDFGNFVTVCAPATNIYTTSNGKTYGYWAGTSFASPIVAAVLALEWAINPNLSNAQVRSIMIQTVDDLGAAGWDQYFGYGKVNAYRAVVTARDTAASSTPPVVTLSNPTAGATLTGPVSVAISATDASAITRIDFYVDGAVVSSGTSASLNLTWDTTKYASGTHTLSAKAYDALGNTGASKNISVTVSNVPVVADTTPPTCVILSPATGTTLTANNLSVKVSAGDNVGVTKVLLMLDGKQVGSATTGSCSFSLNTRKWSSGAHTLIATAYDAAGNKTSSASVTVNR